SSRWTIGMAQSEFAVWSSVSMTTTFGRDAALAAAGRAAKQDRARPAAATRAMAFRGTRNTIWGPFILRGPATREECDGRRGPVRARGSRSFPDRDRRAGQGRRRTPLPGRGHRGPRRQRSVRGGLGTARGRVVRARPPTRGAVSDPAAHRGHAGGRAG